MFHSVMEDSSCFLNKSLLCNVIDMLMNSVDPINEGGVNKHNEFNKNL